MGSEADQNYQNYILRALGQIMIYVDGMTGVAEHQETLKWLYALLASKVCTFCCTLFTHLKLLIMPVSVGGENGIKVARRLCRIFGRQLRQIFDGDQGDRRSAR